MSWLNWIVEDLNSVSDFFYSIYREVLDWVWPFWYAAEFFYDLSRAFSWLAWDFADFAEWVYATVDQLRDILTWSNIQSLISDWLAGIEDVIDWFGSWWVWVGQEIADWWSWAINEVKDLIAIATQGLTEMVIAWNDFWVTLWLPAQLVLVTLQAQWDDFWGNTYPNLVNFTWLTTWWTSRLTDITGLIETAFTLRESLWAGWQELRDQVVEFFADPWEWLLVRWADWFLGPEV